MPLVTQLHQRRDRDMAMNARVHDASLQAQQAKDTDYEDFEVDDECLDSDMEGSIVHRSRPKKVVRAHTIPGRTEKRASQVLKDIMLELQNLDGSKDKEMDSKSAVQVDPHELYLSSEEEGSLSDDDYEDSLLDFEPSEAGELDIVARAPSSGASSRKSQEVTARVVSFTLVKPQIVDIFHSSSPPRPSSSPSSATPSRPSSSVFDTRSARHSSIFEADSTSSSSALPSRPTTRRPSPLKLYPSIRRMSISSMVTSQTLTPPFASSPSASLPPRKSSRMANLASLVTHTLHHGSSHAFLQTDPFPSATSSPNKQPTQAAAKTPTTPTRMAADAFKKGLNKGLHKAQKPSLQKLNAAFSPRNASMLNLSQPEASDSTDQSQIKHQRRKSLAFPQEALPEEPSTPQDGPLRYEDIMKNVIKSPPAEKPSPTKTRISMFGSLSRRKSLRVV